jgi:hypothetical protein
MHDFLFFAPASDSLRRLRQSMELDEPVTGMLTASGKPRGLRGLVEAAALAHRYRETVILSSLPPALQRLLFPLLARFAESNREPEAVRANRSPRQST